MAKIDIRNAGVSYFLRKNTRRAGDLQRGAVGAPITDRGRFLEIAALTDVTLSLANGDRVGLVGINGSGKSTLLKLCAAALSAHSGSIEIDGKVVPQFGLATGLLPDLTGRLNARLKCLYMGVGQRLIPQYVKEVKELSGLGGYFELPVHTYSAGMKSRLVMSLMRLVRGDILVMDEWISAADASVNETANRLQAELITSTSILLIASHSRPILEEWTNRLVWLDRGEVRAVGGVAEVLKEYHAWAAKDRTAR